MIIYIALLAFLIWGVYDGDVSLRAGIILALSFILLNLLFYYMKLPMPYYIVTFVATTIYLVLKIYGGDVKIR